jgi:tetratricopeptide (TPR) repeat protein
LLGRYSESIVVLEKCLKFRRKHYFYKNLADAYFSLGIPEKAVMNYEKAVRLDPQYDEAYYNLAVCEFLQSEYMSAQLNIDQALIIDPDN